VALRLSAGVVVFSSTVNVCETPPAVAVRVAVCVVLTAVAVAVNAALDAPAATVTDDGTFTAELLLARLTVSALLAGADSVTVHESVPAPVSDALLHERAVTPTAAVFASI
jgi:hypothetical protein